jgi:subtilisin family serine protease
MVAYFVGVLAIRRTAMQSIYSSRLICFLSLSLALACSTVSAQSAPQHYVILARSQGARSTAFAPAIARMGGHVMGNLEKIGVVTASSSDPNFAAKVAALPGVQAVAADPKIQWLPKEHNMMFRGQDLSARGINSEPGNPFEWNLRVIHADVTAANGDLGTGARVAVLDSGMDLTNPDLVPNINQALAISFVPGELVEPQCAAPCFNHGTFVAGIIAAAINDFGVQGVAPEAELIPVKVLDEAGQGTFGWIIEGILYATSVRADVINMSLGVTFDVAHAGKDNQRLGTLISALNRAINHATASGTLVVSAAGNDAANLNSSLIFRFLQRLWSISDQPGCAGRQHWLHVAHVFS